MQTKPFHGSTLIQAPLPRMRIAKRIGKKKKQPVKITSPTSRMVSTFVRRRDFPRNSARPKGLQPREAGPRDKIHVLLPGSVGCCLTTEIRETESMGVARRKP